jgi:hypothetical protein
MKFSPPHFPISLGLAIEFMFQRVYVAQLCSKFSADSHKVSNASSIDERWTENNPRVAIAAFTLSASVNPLQQS